MSIHYARVTEFLEVIIILMTCTMYMYMLGFYYDGILSRHNRFCGQVYIFPHSLQLLPVERPSFADINTCLTVIMDDLNDHNDRGSVDGGENIEPQPRNRLSYHEFYSRSRSRSCTPPDLDLTTSRETTV